MSQIQSATACSLMDSLLLNKRPRSDSLDGNLRELERKRPRTSPISLSPITVKPNTVEDIDIPPLPSAFTTNEDTGSSIVSTTRGTATESFGFQHAPLDLSQETIRVIEVLSPGSGGEIQCRVRHTTIDSQYTCLSYVWGAPGDSHIIHMNGKPFRVRRNLWDFLQVASSHEAKIGNLGSGNTAFSFEAATKALWIDALCIDQDNNNERNHQVQQMGSIFSKAQCVLSWMGCDAEYASLLRYMRIDMDNTPFFDAEYFLALDRFCKDRYWKRAWITQEVQLARQVLLVANTEAIDLVYLQTEVNESILATFGTVIYNELWKRINDTIKRDNDLTILENMHRFRWKECSDRLDIVYSLASISRDGLELQVEYAIEPTKLARKLFGLLGEDLCLGHIKTVFQTLDVIDGSDGSYSPDTNQSFIDLEAHILRKHVKRCSNCSFEIDWATLETKYAPHEVYVHCLRCIKRNRSKLGQNGVHIPDAGTPHLLIVQATSKTPETQVDNLSDWRLCLLHSDNTLHEISAGAQLVTPDPASASATVHINLEALTKLVKMTFPRADFSHDEHTRKQSHGTLSESALENATHAWRLADEQILR